MGITERFLYKTERNPALEPAAWRVTAPRQLSGEAAGTARLDPRRLGEAPALTEKQRAALAAGRLTAVNALHPRHEAALDFVTPRHGKKRVHLLAVGDVGSALLLALKLLGGDVISTLGICDLRENVPQRWEFELNQVNAPGEGRFPAVEIVDVDDVLDCDVFLFCASRFVPDTAVKDGDVRMAQYELNRPLAASYGRMARENHFQGLQDGLTGKGTCCQV